MDIIRFTHNAERFLSFIPALDIVNSVNNCFHGLLPWPGVSIPNIYEGVKRLDEEIKKCKRPLRKENENLCQRLASKDVISAFHHNLDFLVENCSVYLATSEDIGKTYINVKNIFTEKEENVLIEYPQNSEEYIKRNGENIEKNLEIKHDSIKDPEYLGLYLPATGSIVLFIDRIFKYVEANLLFQEVLLHEFIHALLDITPRLLKPDGTTIHSINEQLYDSELEEKYDNTLVIYVYHDWSNSDEYAKARIKAFIKSQRPPYCDVNECHKEEYELFQKELIESLLAVKMHTATKELPGKDPSTVIGNTVYGAVDYSSGNKSKLENSIETIDYSIESASDDCFEESLEERNQTFFNQITDILYLDEVFQFEYFSQEKPEFACRYKAKLSSPSCNLTITRISQSLFDREEPNTKNLKDFYCTIYIKIESEDNKIILYHTKETTPVTRVYIQNSRDEDLIKSMYQILVVLTDEISSYSPIQILPAFEELKAESTTLFNLKIIEKII